MAAPPPDHPKTPSFDTIKSLKLLGEGATGTVFLVHNTTTDPHATSPFALKVVDKSSAADSRARWEIEVLKHLSGRNSHPFLPNLISSFETPEFVAYAVPFCSGGDLNSLRRRQSDRVFSPAAVRFYLAEIVCAIEHLHDLGIVYRDLKPENVLLQDSGHVTLTDFDLSRYLTKKTVKTLLLSSSSSSFPDHRRSFSRRRRNSVRVSPVTRRRLSFSGGERSNSFVGTDEYVSPEVVAGDGHDFAVDWWALGVLAYELVYGTSPFKGRNRKETFRNILMKKPEIMGKRNELTDLIERLLEKDPTKRMGYLHGACEIKEHVFFRGLRWDLLTEVVRPPFISDGDSTETLTASGFDIREYYEKLRTSSSPESDCRRSWSLPEF